MAKCKNITPTRKKVCIGALRNRIKIKDRNIRGPLTESDKSHREEFTDLKTVKASITTRGVSVLQEEADVSTDPALTPTHFFIIRYMTSITLTTKQFVEFKGINYKILRVENIDAADLWYRLHSRKLGDATKKGAQ